MTMMYFVVLCAVLSLSVSVVSSCCLPVQWEALEIYLIGSNYNESTTLTRGRVNASFDSQKKKIAYYVDESSSRGYINQERAIRDYNTKTQYDIKDGRCTKSQIYDPYPSQCVPNSAGVEFRSFIPFNKTEVAVTRYSVSMVPNFNEGHVTILEEDCIPLSYQIVGTIEGANSIKSADVYSFSMGIRNSSIFDIPAICKNTKYKYIPKRRQMFQVNWFTV